MAWIGIGKTLWRRGGGFTFKPADAPTGLTLTVISDTATKLNWIYNYNNEDGFVILRAESDDGVNYSDYEIIATIQDVKEYIDENLDKQYYKYIVKAFYDTDIIREKPIIVSAVVNNATANRITLTFDQEIKTTSLPAISSFVVSDKTITLISISNSNVEIFVSESFTYGEDILLTYNKPPTNPIKALVGNVDADSFVDLIVTNNVIFAESPTLQSVVVNNATPTKVILTYDKLLDESSIPSTSDFVVTDHTISSVSVNEYVVELTLSTPFLVFDYNCYLSYAKGKNPIQDAENYADADNISNQIITNNVLDDNNTASWWDATYEASITKDGGGLVSAWADRLGGENTLVNSGADNTKPVWSSDGITFDNNGNDVLTCNYNHSNPRSRYLVIKQISWTANRYIYDGIGAYFYIRQWSTSPILRIFTSAGILSGDLGVGNWGIVRAIYNAATSKLIIDNNDPVTGNTGTSSPTGITLGSANFIIKEFIDRGGADSDTVSNSIYKYLKRKYGL